MKYEAPVFSIMVVEKETRINPRRGHFPPFCSSTDPASGDRSIAISSHGLLLSSSLFSADCLHLLFQGFVLCKRMSEEHEEQEQVLFLDEGKKKKLKKEAEKAQKRGVCYISRVPPGMDHVKLRQLISQYGEIQRIYLVPQNSSSIDRVNDNNKSRKRGGGKAQAYSEGWVEFASKSNAKRVANLLNGEQIGGKKRSQFYYDHWNIKYLSKFKWDNLTEEIAYKKAIREQKLAIEISAAKRERDFYLKKVDQSRALSSIEERMKKKQKVQQESGGELSVAPQKPPVCRQFPQKKPIAERERSKPQLSKDVLAGVFGGS
uniref:RRM domain-containing protein n=1 Tax=Salix viminalis TaxID=40686 RepID=A0A6N2KCB1_SALVM